MLVPTELIIQAKEKLNSDAARIIAQDLGLGEFNENDPKFLCPFHAENTPSFIWNFKENSFKCFGCSAVYGILDHYIDFYKLTFLEAVQKLFEQTGIRYSFGEKGVRTRKDYKYPHYEPDQDKEIIAKYFESRGISRETLDYADVQQCGGLIYWNFYDQNDVLMTVKCRHPKKVDKHSQKEWYLPEFDNSPILYNMNRVDPTKPLVITEGQVDCLSVIEAGYKNCVSIPGGTENMKWLETCFDWLEQFEKIILWFDSDEPGINARKEASARLGIWRTLVVDYPRETAQIEKGKVDVKDANAILCVYGKNKIIDLIEQAEEIPVTGVVNLADVGEFDIEKAPGLYSHLKELDNIIYKFLFGSVILLTGLRGSGKSSFLNQLFINEALEQGYDAFCFSGELDSKVLKNWIDINQAGMEKIRMKNDFVRQINTDTKDAIRKWYDGRVWIFDENTNKIEAILSKAITLTRKFGVKIWIIDNLMTLDIGANDNNVYQKQKELIVNLVHQAKIYNVLIVLVAHPRKLQARQTDVGGDDISGSGDMSNLAQYILSAHRYTDKEKAGEKMANGKFKKGFEPIEHDMRVRVLKNRYTGKLGDAKFYFNYPDYRYYSTLEELTKRFSWNKDQTPYPQEYLKNLPTPLTIF